MIVEHPTLERLRAHDAAVCVIGAGPVGIVTALDLARRGMKVLLLESGGRSPTPATASLSEAENLRPDNHFDPHTVITRRLGGASNLWGGRCLPFDPIDYQARPWLGLEPWPIGLDDVKPYEAAAVAGLGAGAAVWDEPLPEVTADPAFGFTALERWSNVPRTQRLHAQALKDTPNLLVALHTTVLGFDYTQDGGGVAALRLHLEGQGRETLPVRQMILTVGGNESVRLLLAEQRLDPARFGGKDGPLGRFYMGHLTGAVADIVFTDAALHDGLDFHVDGHGCYVRRRLNPSAATQSEAGIANVGFWPVVPRLSNPDHRSGPLSAAHLALSIGPLGRKLISEPIRVKHVGLPPYRRAAHARNVARELLRTAAFVPWFLWHSKVAKRRLPGFFLQNPARRYALEYHSEQAPNPESRITLAPEAADRLGMPRLRIDLRFTPADAASVLGAHGALEAWLARNDLAKVEYHHPDREARAVAVLEAARDGTHQVGTLRMGSDARTAVVDRDCRAFDLQNLYVVSTGVLPTSGQANPTLTAVQLGLRLAERLAGA